MADKHKILIVDDDASLVKMLNVRMQVEGYETARAVDGRTAIELAEEFLPDIVLLDIAMPSVTGVDVIEELQLSQKNMDVPVVIMTSSQADRDILKSYNLHANCFISKQVDVDEFLDTVRSTGEFWLSIVKLPPDDEPS